MPKFLNHLDLNSNQLKNAKLEITDSPTQAKGIIHYHDTDNKVRVYTGTGNSDYMELGGGDITGVTAGTNLTGGGTSGGVTINLADASTTVKGAASFASANFSVSSGAVSIKDGGVALAEMADIATAKVLGNVSGSDAAPALLSASDIRTLINVSSGANANVSGNSGNAAIYDNSGTPTLKTGITQAEMQSAIGVDASGTDNSTPVTLANTNYLSLSGQEITGGTVPVGSGGTGASTLTSNAVLVGNGTNAVTHSSNLSFDDTDVTLAGAGKINFRDTAIHISSGADANLDIVADSEIHLSATTINMDGVADISGNLTVGGNLTVSGGTTTVTSTTVAVTDGMLKLAKDQANNADDIDFGYYGQYGVGGTHKFAGIFRDVNVSGDPFTFFDGLQAEPGTTVDTTGTGYDLADISAGGITAADGFTGAVDLNSGSLTIGGHAIDDIDTGSEFVDADDHIMTSGAIKEKIEDYGYVTDGNVTHRTITAGSNTLANGESLDFVAGTGISISENGGDVTITNTVSNTNTMGTGFTVSATTDSSATTITEGDDLFFAAGTGITCETTADGTVTITNTVTDTNLSIASTTEAVGGSNDTKAMTAAKVADRSVLTTIDVSNSTFTSNLYAEITHGLGTADIIVQLYDINTEQTVEADVYRTDKAGSASTDKIKIVFSAAPASANDIRVLITSLKGGQTGTVAYS